MGGTGLKLSAALAAGVVFIIAGAGCGASSAPPGETAARAAAAARNSGTPQSAAPRDAEEPAPAMSAQVLDWSELKQPGDVTSLVFPCFQNHELNWGSGKLTASRHVELVQAELQAGKLVLTFRMLRPEQRVRFEGLQGGLGTFHPRQARPRPVTIPKASHEERFVRGGTLQIGIPHPSPGQIEVAVAKAPTPIETFREAAEMMREVREKEAAERAKREAAARAMARNAPPQSNPEPKPKPPGLLPDPESGYTPRSRPFAELAASLSAMYKMPGRDTFRPVELAREEGAKAAVAYGHPKMKQYADKLIQRWKDDKNIDLNAVRADLHRQASVLDGNIASGAYSRRESSYDYGPTGDRIPVSRTVDESGWARSRSAELSRIASLSDADLREWVQNRRDQNDWDWLFFGDGISNRRDDLYTNIVLEAHKVLIEEAQTAAGPKQSACLISMHRLDSATPGMRNESGKILTDVLVHLSWGFTRSDKLKKYGHGQLVFIPVWKPGEKVELQKFGLKEPYVAHAQVKVYANEASSEGHAFSMVDPSNPPNNQPGTLVVWEYRGLAGLGKPPFEGTAWIEVDGKRTDWKDVKNRLEIPLGPGEYQLSVHAKPRRGRSRVIYDKPLVIDGGKQVSVDVSFLP